MNNPILLSTGWMHSSNPTIEELEEYCQKAHNYVDGFELVVTNEIRKELYDTSDLPDCLYTVHHSPTQPLTDISSILDRYNPNSVVYHPTEGFNITEVEQFYQDRTATPTLENLDSKYTKEYSHKLLELKSSYGFGLTLDIQHIYEHDHTLEYGWDLLTDYGERLTQIHVSGESTETNHSLLQHADNNEQIDEFISRVSEIYPHIPLVIEGKYHTEEQIRDEVSHLENLIYRNKPK